uniref:Uncharacterized protein n=1 Tax=Micrurus carvalhoi TaxID=3147026 RepID=A0A2H6N1N3_9SAUR
MLLAVAKCGWGHLEIPLGCSVLATPALLCEDRSKEEAPGSSWLELRRTPPPPDMGSGLLGARRGSGEPLAKILQGSESTNNLRKTSSKGKLLIGLIELLGVGPRAFHTL